MRRVLDAEVAVGGADVASAEGEAIGGVGIRAIGVSAEAGVEGGEVVKELAEVGLVGAVGGVVTPFAGVVAQIDGTETEMEEEEEQKMQEKSHLFGLLTNSSQVHLLISSLRVSTVSGVSASLGHSSCHYFSWKTFLPLTLSSRRDIFLDVSFLPFLSLETFAMFRNLNPTINDFFCLFQLCHRLFSICGPPRG